jgi:hypothetical protein
MFNVRLDHQQLFECEATKLNMHQHATKNTNKPHIDTRAPSGQVVHREAAGSLVEQEVA